MLKLKYLFENNHLAKMILDNWEYDKDDPDLFKYFRISSNAIYWCKNKGKLFILRFAPASEKNRASIQAELDFARYLNTNGYYALETIPSKTGNELELVATPWGDYYASAFKRAAGVELSRIDINDELVFEWGKALGKLHKLSTSYNPASSDKRDSWKDKLTWVKQVLDHNTVPPNAYNELELLEGFLSKLPVNNDNYGLIHFDFEPDNVFYDETSKRFTAIDFDDAMYHWYAADVSIALESIKEELPEERQESASETFIKGYQTEFEITDADLSLMPVFQRFTYLYGYARVLYSVKEIWNHEPDWMVELRQKLSMILEQRSRYFGMPL